MKILLLLVLVALLAIGMVILKMSIINKKVRYKIPAHYSIKILSNKQKLSYTDKKFIEIILNFHPKFNNFKCEINRYDKYVEYMENVRAFIYCEAIEDNWNNLGSNLIELEKYIEYEKERNFDDFNAFLHLIEVDNDNYTSMINREIVRKIIDYINDSKREYQIECDISSKIYVSLGCSVNDYKIIWGNENCINLMMESYG